MCQLFFFWLLAYEGYSKGENVQRENLHLNNGAIWALVRGVTAITGTCCVYLASDTDLERAYHAWTQ